MHIKPLFKLFIPKAQSKIDVQLNMLNKIIHISIGVFAAAAIAVKESNS